VRLDDGFASHPKMVAAGPLGLAMQVAALCYCNRYLTDGYVPRAVPASLLNLEELAFATSGNGDAVGAGCDADAAMVVGDLVQAGVWEEADGGWLIHDYFSYQPSKEEVLAERAAARERMSKHRKLRANFARSSEEVQGPRSRRELLRSSLEERQPKTAAAVPQEPGPEPARCPVCGITKKTRKALDDHLANVHGQEQA
jgi:hypothetical protein